MIIYYSKETGGFYDDSIHKTIPQDAVEITKQQHRDLLNGQSNGKKIVSDDTGYPFVIYPPSADIHVPILENGEWVEGETAEQQEIREQKEYEEERDRLDAMTASRFQAKAALDDAGLLDQVEAYMAGENVPKRVKLAWKEASFRRGSNMVNAVGVELGLSEQQIDDLFIAAQDIEA